MSLKSDFYDVFMAMKNDGKDDAYFGSQIDSIIKDYAESLTLTPTPSTLAGADTGPTGTFSGAVASISWKFQGGKVKAAIKAATDKKTDMKDDDLSKAIAKGLDDDPPTWSCTISGATTLSPPATPPTTPSSDSGSITSTFQSAPVKSSLDSAFSRMKSMINEGDDGDDVFATELANAVKLYYTSSVNQGKGASHLAAVQFAVLVTE